MKSLLICVSVSNGNTRRVADRMAEVLGAEVLEPEAVDVAFTFFTSGGPELPLLGYRRAVHRRLTSKGCEVLDSFSCRGLDTVGPLRWVGGVNKGRPNDADLDRAAAFATQLRERVAQSPRAR